jgi:hypothetical protein
VVAWSSGASGERDRHKKQHEQFRVNETLDSPAKLHNNNQLDAAVDEKILKLLVLDTGKSTVFLEAGELRTILRICVLTTRFVILSGPALYSQALRNQYHVADPAA